MHQDAKLFLKRLIHELENLSGHLVVIIKQQLQRFRESACGVVTYLSIIVKPVKSQILNSDLRPLIPQMVPRTVHNMRDLIHSQELQILHNTSHCHISLSLPETSTSRP